MEIEGNQGEKGSKGIIGIGGATGATGSRGATGDRGLPGTAVSTAQLIICRSLKITQNSSQFLYTMSSCFKILRH